MTSTPTAQAAAEALWRSPRTLRRAYADYRYGQLHYRLAQPERPSGVPLLMFHQTGSSGRCYENFIAEMGRDRIAAIADTPSSGTSDPLPHAPLIEDFADAMGELIDHLGFDRLDLAGDHTGAMTAVEVAIRNPARVRRIVLNAAPIFAPGETAVRTFPRPPDDANGTHVHARWKRVMNYFADKSLTLGELEFIEGLRPGPFTHHGPNAVFSYPLGERLPRVTQRVLVLHAKDDLWIPTERARAYIRDGEMIDLPQYGREILMAHYHEVAAIVRRFLDTP